VFGARAPALMVDIREGEETLSLRGALARLARLREEPRDESRLLAPVIGR
jgi:hypothetical protein